jgi:hypothetical protein
MLELITQYSKMWHNKYVICFKIGFSHCSCLSEHSVCWIEKLEIMTIWININLLKLSPSIQTTSASENPKPNNCPLWAKQYYPYAQVLAFSQKKKKKKTLIKRFYYICKVYNIEDYLENNIATCRSDLRKIHTQQLTMSQAEVKPASN